MTKRFFVTATGTNQGKTLVTTALCWQLRQQGKTVSALKPVISGGVDDSTRILQSLGLPATSENIHALSPWQFTAALSPDEAARQESKSIDLDEVVEFCLNPESRILNPDMMLIEGAGGLMSPLSEAALNIDLIMAVDAPVILVSASYLGCVSHILSALSVLRDHAITVAGLVLSEVDPTAQSAEITLRSLKPHLPPALLLIVVNHLESDEEMWKNAPDLTPFV
jgi:dethiobiotin synthetase